jgi:CDP-paratose 2-epimerase
MSIRLREREPSPILITGSCGFIGTNLADRLLRRGRQVLLFDNLSRPGVERSCRWLLESRGAPSTRLLAGKGVP